MRISYFALLVVGLCLAACNQASKTSDPTGTYNLVSIDGHALPYSPIPTSDLEIVVLSSTLTLNADGTFYMTIRSKDVVSDSVSRDFSGTYTREGSDFKMLWKGAGVVTNGTFEEDTFTVNNEGVLFAYQK